MILQVLPDAGLVMHYLYAQLLQPLAVTDAG